MNQVKLIRTISVRLVVLTLFVLASSLSCNKKGTDNSAPPPPPPAETITAEAWFTYPDQTMLLSRQTVAGGTVDMANPIIDIDTTQVYQTVDGFGYTLTSGSATMINSLAPAAKTSVLRELFTTENNGIGISYLRISIGASDLSASVYSYDDMPAGQTDPNLANFSLAPDLTDLIPLLKEILAINPRIKVLATPWSPPVWMKDNGSSVGGSLLPQYYSVYAQYFVKYIQQMAAQGITVDAITPQNEPLHPGNNPSMLMTAVQEADFIKNHLGPAFQSAGINTKVILYDHNADRPDYPLTILNDVEARKYVNGSAFHLYAGNIEALSAVHDAYPDKQIYFTEQYTASTGDFGGDLKWHLKNVIIGSMRNWSRIALEWNLANDASFGPHTPGGCTTCKGALTISGSSVTRNVAYYIIGQASKFIPPGSVRIDSHVISGLPSAAFKTPDGKKVVIVENEGASGQAFNIRFHGKWIPTSLPAGGVGTYVW